MFTHAHSASFPGQGFVRVSALSHAFRAAVPRQRARRALSLDTDEHTALDAASGRAGTDDVHVRSVWQEVQLRRLIAPAFEAA